MTINLVGTTDRCAARFRRNARAATVAGALVLGIGAFGHTAVASAEWDTEYYDRCLRIGTNPVICCLNSGGQLPTVGHGCIAPPLWDSIAGNCRAAAESTAPKSKSWLPIASAAYPNAL